MKDAVSTPAIAPDVSKQQATGETPPVTITDGLLFRWAHIIKIVKLIPQLNAVRELERKKYANQCNSCRHTHAVLDMSPLNAARDALANCSANTAALVKQAAGVLQYHVSYRKLDGTLREVVR
jgi:hypothetical protein